MRSSRIGRRSSCQLLSRSRIVAIERSTIGGSTVLSAANIQAIARARAFASSGSSPAWRDRKSTRLNSSHSQISYAVFCLKKKKKKRKTVHKQKRKQKHSIKPNS